MKLCQKEQMAAGETYPRTCGDCGLMGPCTRGYDWRWTPQNPVGFGPTSQREAIFKAGLLALRLDLNLKNVPLFGWRVRIKESLAKILGANATRYYGFDLFAVPDDQLTTDFELIQLEQTVTYMVRLEVVVPVRLGLSRNVSMAYAVQKVATGIGTSGLPGAVVRYIETTLLGDEA